MLPSVMGIDQYGTHYRGLDLAHPRRDLLAQLGAQNARKMYVDTKDGKTKHIGYVIGRLWIRLYVVSEWKKEAKC